MPARRISQRYRDHYADYTPRPSEWYRAGALGKVDSMVALCSGVGRGSLLEIGSGEGSVLARLAALGFARELHAVDVSERSIGAVRERGIPTLASAEVFDGVRLPHADRSMDLVVLTHVLEHAEHPRSLLDEAARVGRHVFVEVPLEDHWGLPRDFVLDATGHINFYHARSIRHLVQSCGLEVLDERVVTPAREGYVYQYGRSGGVRFRIKQLALRALPRLATRIWTYHGALLCRPAA
jgi:SAM-dependent methyltransferase